MPKSINDLKFDFSEFEKTIGEILKAYDYPKTNSNNKKCSNCGQLPGSPCWSINCPNANKITY